MIIYACLIRRGIANFPRVLSHYTRGSTNELKWCTLRWRASMSIGFIARFSFSMTFPSWLLSRAWQQNRKTSAEDCMKIAKNFLFRIFFIFFFFRLEKFFCSFRMSMKFEWNKRSQRRNHNDNVFSAYCNSSFSSDEGIMLFLCFFS